METREESNTSTISLLARRALRRCRNSLELTLLLIGVGAVVITIASLTRQKAEPTTSWRDSRSEPPRVALCFFGLTRSLRYTLPSVQARLRDVLLQDGFEVDIFVHTYHLREVTNERTGELGIRYAKYDADYLALNATRALVTDQDDFDLAWPDPLSLTHYNWHYSPEIAFGVVRNIFRAYWSMGMVWGLMAQYAIEGDFEYDAVILARPDVWYHVDVDLPRRTFPLPEKTVFLPSFDIRDDFRQNDRFAYGSVSTMRVMMHRLATLMDPRVGQYVDGCIDSEWVLGHHLREHNMSVTKIKFPFSRIRINGGVAKVDHGKVRRACFSRDDPVSCQMLRHRYEFPGVIP